MAIKAIYAEFQQANGELIKMPVFKDPKTDREDGGDNMKKSHKGCVRVTFGDGDYHCQDGLNFDESMYGNEMKTIFKDSKMVYEESLSEIRNRLNENKF